jgi:hypothetical protein
MNWIPIKQPIEKIIKDLARKAKNNGEDKNNKT